MIAAAAIPAMHDHIRGLEAALVRLEPSAAGLSRAAIVIASVIPCTAVAGGPGDIVQPRPSLSSQASLFPAAQRL